MRAETGIKISTLFGLIITPHGFYMIVRLLFITSFSTALWCIYKSEVTHCQHIGKKLSKLVFMLYFEFLVVLCNKVKYTKTSTDVLQKVFCPKLSFVGHGGK